MQKFKIGDMVVIKSADLLNNGWSFDSLLGERLVVLAYYQEDNTYCLKKTTLIGTNSSGVWVSEDSLSEAPRIYFEPVIDSMRKHIGVELQMPKMGSKHAVACDFYSPVDITIKPMTSGMIWTDLKAIFSSDVALIMNVRSSMGKQPIMLANTLGWIECDYANNEDNDGNIGINLFNLGTTDYVIKKGDRIAQGMFVNILRAEGTDTDVERIGGHGSTGK